MNSLSVEEISGQLFHLSKECVKTITLNSKCGLLAHIKTSKKSSSTNDISILNDFSPLLCLYRKASPTFIHGKSSHSFDEMTFKKEILPSTNALMTLSLLQLSEYYSHFKKGSRNITSFENPYKFLAKEQLQFYSEHLRNPEGLFVCKKNISEGNSKGFNLVDKNNKFKFCDQAFMMDAYLLYSIYNENDESCEDYKAFSYEILNLFKDYKDSLYELSFNENIQIFFALNFFYEYSNSIIARELILDLGDYLITKFQDKDYYNDSLDDCAFFSITLMHAYKHTDIISFKDIAKEINDKLLTFYDEDKNIFLKNNDKKEVKYSCLEINFYLLSLMMYSNNFDKAKDLKPIISSLFRKFYVNSNLLTCWPEAPTLDEVERYKKLSLHSEDMLDETYFRMPILPTPKSTGIAPVFLKNIEYSKKKDSFNKPRLSFDSNKNMLSFFIMINSFKDNVEKTMQLDCVSEQDKVSTRNTNKSDDSKSDDTKPNDNKSTEIIAPDIKHTLEELEPVSPITLNGLTETNTNSNENNKKSKNRKNSKNNN